MTERPSDRYTDRAEDGCLLVRGTHVRDDVMGPEELDRIVSFLERLEARVGWAPSE